MIKKARLSNHRKNQVTPLTIKMSVVVVLTKIE